MVGRLGDGAGPAASAEAGLRAKGTGILASFRPVASIRPSDAVRGGDKGAGKGIVATAASQPVPAASGDTSYPPSAFSLYGIRLSRVLCLSAALVAVAPSDGLSVVRNGPLLHDVQ